MRNIEGWGKLSINNLKKAIEKSKVIGLDRFIFSIGIRHIGQENAKILASFLRLLINFLIYLMKKVEKNFRKFD